MIIIDENDENKRLDSFLANLPGEFSRSKIQSFIKQGKVLVNSETKKSSYVLREGDRVEFSFPSVEEIKIPAQNIPLEIIYEDENMLVVNKPSGMLTHPTMQELENTLVNALLYRYSENLSDINGEFRPGILHRLDRNTSGLLMVAKNNKAHEFLAQQIKNRTMTKKYRAIVNGNIKQEEFAKNNFVILNLVQNLFEINAPIGRHPRQPHKMAVVPDGKESLTKVKVLKHFHDAAYLELNLITGRTHQIRVHLSHLKHPIYNDSLYGGSGKVKTEEQVLQSYYLRFTKPFGDEIIELEIEPDEKIKRVLNYLQDMEEKC